VHTPPRLLLLLHLMLLMLLQMLLLKLCRQGAANWHQHVCINSITRSLNRPSTA
jgi:hypothetical protein